MRLYGKSNNSRMPSCGQPARVRMVLVPSWVLPSNETLDSDAYLAARCRTRESARQSQFDAVAEIRGNILNIVLLDAG